MRLTIAFNTTMAATSLTRFAEVSLKVIALICMVFFTHKMTSRRSIMGFWERMLKFVAFASVVSAASQLPRWALECFAIIVVSHWAGVSPGRREEGSRTVELERMRGDQERGVNVRTAFSYSLRYLCDWEAMLPAYPPPLRKERDDSNESDGSCEGAADTNHSDEAPKEDASCAESHCSSEQCCICFEPTSTPSIDENAEEKNESNGPDAGTPRLLRALPCAHVFHADCIDRWLTPPRARPEQLACPVCKNTVPSRPVLYLHRRRDVTA